MAKFKISERKKMGRRTPVHAEVIIFDQQQVEKMIKKFTRKVKKSGILDEVRERRHFTKKSVKRRLKRLSKKRNSQKSTEKMKERMEKYS